MNSSETTDIQLWHLANKLGIPLLDVCYKDKLNDSPPSAGAYIINLANHTQHGTHWVGLWLERPGQGIYFDSFGCGPPIAVEDFAARYGCIQLIVSSEQIQSINEGHCGQFVLDFLAFMNHNKHKPLKDRLLIFLSQFQYL